MTITPKTTVHTLVKEYPFLLDFLAAYNPEFVKLTNPVLRRTMARMATLERVSVMGDVPLNQLMMDLATAIEQQTGTNPGVADNAAGGGVDAERLDALKQIVLDLHDGQPLDEMTKRFNEMFEDVDASEIAVMEQQLIDDGLPVAEVMRLCDVHVRVFSSALDLHDRVKTPAGHPVNNFQAENDEIKKATAVLRDVLEQMNAHGPSGLTLHKTQLAAALEGLAPIDVHYLRKENQLFPFLEKHGIKGPSQVMWGIHDEIRAALNTAVQSVEDDRLEDALQASEWVVQAVDDMVTKEEQVLFPMSMEHLNEREWIEIRSGEDEVGYAYLSNIAPWPAPSQTPAFFSLESLGKTLKEKDSESETGEPTLTAGPTLVPLDTGALTFEQVNLLLGTIKLDVSFVDENDEVRYYNEGERIFPRSPGVIGRKVQNCHPPTSVHKVQEILDAFRAGTKDVADFWIQMQGKFLHIRYFAMRDADGAYRGTLETVQDVTEIRALEGQRRLVDW